MTKCDKSEQIWHTSIKPASASSPRIRKSTVCLSLTQLLVPMWDFHQEHDMGTGNTPAQSCRLSNWCHEKRHVVIYSIVELMYGMIQSWWKNMPPTNPKVREPKTAGINMHQQELHKNMRLKHCKSSPWLLFTLTCKMAFFHGMGDVQCPFRRFAFRSLICEKQRCVQMEKLSSVDRLKWQDFISSLATEWPPKRQNTMRYPKAAPRWSVQTVPISLSVTIGPTLIRVSSSSLGELMMSLAPSRANGSFRFTLTSATCGPSGLWTLPQISLPFLTVCFIDLFLDLMRVLSRKNHSETDILPWILL